MEYEAGAKILQALIMAGVGFFILFKIPSVENISYGYLIANLATLILVLLFFHFRICPLNLGLDKNIWRKFFRSSWPLGLVAILGAVFMNIDSVIMGYWGQIAEVGWYNAARRIIGFITIPGTLIMMSFGPVMSKFFTESREKLQRVWNFYTESTIILAIPIVFGGLILAPKIIDFIYDQNFSLSIFVFQILIFATGINFLYNPYLVMLFISDQQKKYLWINLTAAIINIILNLILIPRYSLYGAAIATVITYLVILLLGIESLRKFTSVSIFNPRLPKILIMTIVSSLVMLAAIIQPFIYSLNVIIAIIIGMLIYFIILFLFYKSLYGLNFLLKNLAEK